MVDSYRRDLQTYTEAGALVYAVANIRLREHWHAGKYIDPVPSKVRKEMVWSRAASPSRAVAGDSHVLSFPLSRAKLALKETIELEAVIGMVVANLDVGYFANSDPEKAIHDAEPAIKEQVIL